MRTCEEARELANEHTKSIQRAQGTRHYLMNEDELNIVFEPVKALYTQNKSKEAANVWVWIEMGSPAF
jgi:hypothetical protein